MAPSHASASAVMLSAKPARGSAAAVPIVPSVPPAAMRRLGHVLRRGMCLILLSSLTLLTGAPWSRADAQDSPQPKAGVEIDPNDVRPQFHSPLGDLRLPANLGPLGTELRRVNNFIDSFWPTIRTCDKTIISRHFSSLRNAIDGLEIMDSNSIPGYGWGSSRLSGEELREKTFYWARRVLEWGKEKYNKYYDRICAEKPKKPPPAKEAPPADKDGSGKPGTGKGQQGGNAVAPHPLITTHMAKLRAAFKEIKDAIGQCDEAAYERSVAKFKKLTDYSMKWNLSREDQQRHKVLLDSAIGEMRAMLTNIPTYPDPCEINNVYYPELEFIAEQNIIAGTMLWPYFICDTQKVREFFKIYFSINPALKAMRAAAIALAVGKAKPGSADYERRIKAGQIGRLIDLLDTFVTNTGKYQLKKSHVEFMLTPGTHCPHSAAANRARIPTIMRWLTARGHGNVIPSMRAMHKGKTAIALPEQVRAAALNAGLKIPPYSELPYNWK